MLLKRKHESHIKNQDGNTGITNQWNNAFKMLIFQPRNPLQPNYQSGVRAGKTFSDMQGLKEKFPPCLPEETEDTAQSNKLRTIKARDAGN